VIDCLTAKSIFVNRFWVQRFVRRHSEKFAIERAKDLEKERHEVSAKDPKTYFVSITAHLTSVPSKWFWNADEICVDPAKHISPPDVIVASETKQGSVTVPEIRDDAQLTLITATSAFGHSTYPYLISKSKTFKKTTLEAQQLFEGHDYTIRMTPKPFVTETLFIDWLETVFLVRINEFR
jgi:hypothetical protein